MRTTPEAAQDIIRELYRQDLLRQDTWVESEVTRILEDQLDYFHKEFRKFLLDLLDKKYPQPRPPETISELCERIGTVLPYSEAADAAGDALVQRVRATAVTKPLIEKK